MCDIILRIVQRSKSGAAIKRNTNTAYCRTIRILRKYLLFNIGQPQIEFCILPDISMCVFASLRDIHRARAKKNIGSGVSIYVYIAPVKMLISIEKSRFCVEYFTAVETSAQKRIHFRPDTVRCVV